MPALANTVDIQERDEVLSRAIFPQQPLAAKAPQANQQKERTRTWLKYARKEKQGRGAKSSRESVREGCRVDYCAGGKPSSVKIMER